jgi:hypothetical protein
MKDTFITMNYLVFLQYPDLINVIEIGQTFERRPILLAKIAKKNKNVISHTAKRAIFIEAGKAFFYWLHFVLEVQ